MQSSSDALNTYYQATTNYPKHRFAAVKPKNTKY